MDDRSNEITAIPELLKTLALDGCLVTIDRVPSGWGCQKRIAQTLRDRGTDYVLALKGNQPQLHEAVVETFAVEQAEGFEGCDHDFHQTVNKNHGRIETRRCWVLGTPEYTRYVDPGGAWSDLHSLVMIDALCQSGRGRPGIPPRPDPGGTDRGLLRGMARARWPAPSVRAPARARGGGVSRVRR